jgi:hypothetical protein
MCCAERSGMCPAEGSSKNWWWSRLSHSAEGVMLSLSILRVAGVQFGGECSDARKILRD